MMLTTDIPIPHADKIAWQTNQPVWVEKLCVSEKLAAAEQLVQN